MRIAIMGSGGIGGLCGARLVAAGADVLFIARGAHLDAMRRGGLRLESALGDVTLDKVDVTDRPATAEPADIVLFTVKGPDTDAAIEAMAPLVGPTTGIICFQNGVAGIDKLAHRFGRTAVMPGSTMTTAIIAGPGIIRHVGTSNSFTFGEWDGEPSERAQAFHLLAQKSGLNMQLSTNPHQDVWWKLVAASAGMSVTCLTRLPVRTCAETEETRQHMIEIMREVIMVARARGVEVPPDSIDRVLNSCQTLDPKWKTSMLTDLEAGRLIEADSVFGAVHRMGIEFGVPTPAVSVTYRILSPYTRPRPVGLT